MLLLLSIQLTFSFKEEEVRHKTKFQEALNNSVFNLYFVDDIDLYFKACDLFINPLLDGGGIKTKLVEALGFGKKAVSTVNGAIGVEEFCTQGRLKIVADGDWEQFAARVNDAVIAEEVDSGSTSVCLS